MYLMVFKGAGGVFAHQDFSRHWFNRLRSNRLLGFLISLFIIFNVYFLAIMAMPVSWPCKRILLRVVLPVTDYLGLTHYHNFYSPNPPMSDRRVDFVVLFNDGKSIYWQYPRDKLVFFDHPSSFHRYVQEYLWWGPAYNHAAFPYFASFILKHTNSADSAGYYTESAGHYPVAVKFIAREIKTFPPEEPYNKLVQPKRFTFYTYPVAPGEK